MLLACSIEYTPGFIIAMIATVLIGVPVLTTSFFIIRRLHELHTSHNKIDGELFISDTGDMYAEYGIPIPEILERSYILLKVNHISPIIKTKGGKVDE